MDLEIFYFSGTGNSLSVATDLSKITNGKLLPITSFINNNDIEIKSEMFGIVFPCYLAQKDGIPEIVKDFVSKLINIKSKYIFAICTCGGFETVNALPTLKRLGKLIKLQGGILKGEFSIKLPMNNLEYPTIFNSKNQEKMFQNQKITITKINKRIMNKKSNK